MKDESFWVWLGSFALVMLVICTTPVLGFALALNLASLMLSFVALGLAVAAILTIQ